MSGCNSIQQLALGGGSCVSGGPGLGIGCAVPVQPSPIQVTHASLLCGENGDATSTGLILRVAKFSK